MQRSAHAVIISLIAALVWIAVSWSGSVLAQEPCGTGACGGGLQCMRCPGREPTCARPPAQCCGSGICGDGLQCLSCPGREPTCARPPAVCCGDGMCGGGLLCVNTAQGPQCQIPAASTPPPSDDCGGAGPCGGGLQCARCPGSPPTCARPPFQCCGSAGICGAGLQCAMCPGTAPTCARPPFQCCGSAGVCGDGLVCDMAAAGGPVCVRAVPQTPVPQSDDCGGAGPCGGGLQCARCPGSAPTCARPPFQCCGSAGPCGDGLVCDMTAPGGAVCKRPSPSTPSQSTSGPIPPGVPTQGQFRSRWDQVGGSWTTGWVPNHPFQGCIHGISCSCGAENYCGNYRNGQTATAWPEGCGGPRWTIRCTSERQPPAAKPKPPAAGAGQTPHPQQTPPTPPKAEAPSGFLGDGDGPWFCCQWMHSTSRKQTCAPGKNRALCLSYEQGSAVDNAECVEVQPGVAGCKPR